ncbi:hypothetical protein Bbelb_004230 [Branchiostoma belcheri]|nr:hypothetical protein Bbelb_004230 [Branchiostoma belcheri]
MASGRVTAVLVAVLALTSLHEAGAQVTINSVSPNAGSRKGGTRMRILGSGIPKEFSMEFDVLSVNFVSSTQSYPCDVEKTSVSDRQIECYTSAMPLGHYTPEVTVCTSADPGDCTTFRCQDPERCTFETNNWRTPFIQTITPNTGYPGSMITVYGKIITCLFGSDKSACTNGRTEEITRCYQEGAGQTCALRDVETQEMYGIEMDNDGTSVWGNMQAKLQGKFVGHQNITFIVGGAFGRADSLTQAKMLDYGMKISNFETYAKVSSVSPGTGSEQGRSTITVAGEWFDSTTQNVAVKVGGEECSVPDDITDEEIVCLTPARPANGRDNYPGNRGVNKDFWTYADPASMPALTDLPTGDPSETEWGDSTTWGAREGSFISRSRFFFKPPNDNTYQFILFDCNKPADDFLLRFEDENGEVSEWTCPDEGRGYSPRMPLEAANSHYMEAWYRHDASAGGDNEADKQISMRMFDDTKYVGGQNRPARNERQKVIITSTVNRETQNVGLSGSVTEFTVTHGTVTSESISDSASASEVQAALQAMYQNKCPEEVANPIGAMTKFATDYESGRNPSWSTGTVVKADETMPFCGGKSLMNPTILYNTDPENDFYPVQISIEKMFCFAYKGSLASRLFLRYSHGPRDQVEEASEWFGPDDSDSLDFSSGEDWQYTCVDLQELFSSARPDATNVKVKEVRVQSTSEDSDFFIDNLFFGKAEPMAPGSVASSIREAATPNDVLIDEVEVQKVDGGFSVSFIPFNCGYNLPLMTSQGGVTITREVSGSPPVQGTFDITFKGSTSTVRAEATEEEMANKLNLDLGISARVTLEGDCSAPKWEVEWVTAGGNQPEMELDGGALTGDDVAIDVRTLDDGGLFFLTMPGSMLRTAHDTPQFEVTINGIPSRCEGDCGFTWAADRTPTITSISPGQGTGGTEVTIAGTGFSTNCDDMRVKIGRSEDTEEGVRCTPTTCTETSITCTAGSAGQGSQRVKVKVMPHGDDPDASPNGKAAGDVTFTYLGGITSISPDTSGLGGGVDLTISGNGFADDDTPRVGENDCAIVSRTSSEIVCTVPAGSSAGAVDVTVSGPDDDVLTSPTQFTYNEALTPVISSYTPEDITVAGGDTLTVEGTGFGDSPALTLDCDSETVSLEASVTESGGVTATLPSLSPGECNILLFVPGSGYAMVQESSRKRSANRFRFASISVTLKVTGMDVSEGSLYGGTLVILEGNGFSEEAANNEVMFGEIGCEVETSSDSRITCRTGSTATSHTVTNDGSHPVHGAGYAWDPADLTVTVGDTVVWRWASSGSGAAYGIHQTTDSTGEEQAGFSSGEQTSSGAFQQSFKTVGTSYYTSGCVDAECNIKMLGKVRVVAAEDATKGLSVTVHGKEANQIPRSSRRRRNGAQDPSGSCPGGTDPLLPCPGDPPEAPEGAVYSFSFRNCMTAEASGSVTQGTAGTLLTFQGTGFSTEACENVVMIGEHQCEIETASASTLACRVAPGDDMPVGTPQFVSVNVKNRGFAIVTGPTEATYTFTLLPAITSVSPEQGSTEGGTTVTISGSGFTAGTDGTMVAIGSSGCDIQSMSYNDIICTTQPASPLTRDVVVTQVVNGNSLGATCDGTCQFSHRDSATPRAVSIEPTTASGASTDFTITGALFGTDSDAVTVEIGGTPCEVTAVTDSSISCTTGPLRVGSNDVSVVNALGAATSSLTVDSLAQADSVSPSSGSMAGGTVVTISGNGFADDTTVSVGDAGDCEITELTATSISCVTPAATQDGDHTVQVSVVSNGQTYPSLDFTYAADRTPVVDGISPSQGTSGDTVTITGSRFTSGSTRRRRNSSSGVSVYVGAVPCPLSSVSSTALTCTLGDMVAGSYPVSVNVAGMGLAVSSTTFMSQMSLESVDPPTGSFGGGLTLTLGGSGFSASTVATVCGVSCPVTNTEPLELECTLPAYNGASSGQVACDVEVEDNGVTESLPAAFTYDSAMTPVIDSVSPAWVAPQGELPSPSVAVTWGNHLQMCAHVAKFPMYKSKDVSSVTIEGSACDITAASASELTCVTGAHQGSVQGKVTAVSPYGIAQQDNADFYYADRWSSRFTWGGEDLPGDGDFVIVEQPQTLLLDTETAVLSMLLIDGGSLIFYDEMDVHLQAEKILIVNGGTLQAGTHDDPFEHQALITLWGHLRSKELPIYGTKNIGLRGGVLDLHGMPVDPTWTLLAQTATAGSNSLVLEEAVSGWNPGDSVVIATTGHRHSQGETEVREIQSVSEDGHTVTLTESLEYEHLGVVETVDGLSLSFQAEVGLLSRTVRVQGSSATVGWDREIEACPEGFDTGEFVTQTCFEGRFGDEVGSDQFGAHVMVHGEDVTFRIENTELTNMGQAFRLGRYAVHSHLNGDMSGSYVRGNAIHRSFNRAIVMHATNYLQVEDNVIYDIMGGAVFLEDGVEIGNVIQGNFACFVKSSTSLLNDDIMPANFWAINPNNTLSYNHAAGGTHFGFWYDPPEHPHGPSRTVDSSPQNAPLGEFRGNVVHSQGWFGLWIFEEYHPNEPAIFRDFTVYRCEKGAEAVNVGAITFDNFKMYDNDKAGIEWKRSFVDSWGLTGVTNSDIVAHTALAGDDEGTAGGVILPFGPGFSVDGTKFYNFDRDGSTCIKPTRIDGTCNAYCSGFGAKFSGIEYFNSPNKGEFEFEHESFFMDVDGTLTGTNPGAYAVPSSDILPPGCSESAEFSLGDFPGSVCTDSNYKLKRFAFNKALPSSLLNRNTWFENEFGRAHSTWQIKRMTHGNGWMVDLVEGQNYKMTFEDSEHITNISYTGTFFDLEDGDYLIITHELSQKPDRFSVIEGDDRDGLLSPIDPVADSHGDWYFDESTNVFSYLVKGEGNGVDRDILLRVYRCAFEDCIAPLDPAEAPPSENRPDDYVVYGSSDVEWYEEDGFLVPSVSSSPDRKRSALVPTAGDSLRIDNIPWMVLGDNDLPRLDKLHIVTVLELWDPLHPYTRDYTIEATVIFIQGGRLVCGWPDENYLGNVIFSLLGDHSTPDMPLPSGPNVGSKAIGDFGGLDLFGDPKSPSWTSLAQTANTGDITLTLQDPVNWQRGDEIVVSPTGFNAWETETFTITDVSDDMMTLTLDAPLQHRHIYDQGTYGGKTYTFAAEVGSMTRNIKIAGAAYDEQEEESFGARLLVGSFNTGGQTYTGYARISNVEFVRSGQEGWTDSYDPRYSVAFMDLGDIESDRPSFIDNSVIHDAYAPGIGIYGTNNLNVSNNVIHHSVGQGIIAEGVGNALTDNLVVLSIFPGTYQDRFEASSDKWQGAVEVQGATSVVLERNHIAGAERIGLHADGEPCDDDSWGWEGNQVHTALHGIHLYEDGQSDCTRIRNFEVFKCYAYGLHYQSQSSVVVENTAFVDNRLGSFMSVVGPPSLDHARVAKSATVRNSLYVGRSASFDCDTDVMDRSDDNLKIAAKWGGLGFTSNKGSSGGFIGFAFAGGMSGWSGSPLHPWWSQMSYPTLDFDTRISDTTFANYDDACGKEDVAMHTWTANEDAFFPVSTENLSFDNTPLEHRVFFDRPSVRLVNPSDCVDMSCDGKVEGFILDLDGTLLGASGAITTQADWEWDGDARYGRGDYRIPNTMLSDLSGNRIEPNTLAPEGRGIVRNNGCEKNDEMHAYLCPDMDYRMLTLESMDADTETRRLSPVALLSNGYVDLINGPQDHGWCAGYTCSLRISTFQAVVVPGEDYLVHYTGVSPRESRYFMPDAEEDDTLLLGLFFSNPERLDVYADGVFVEPKNSVGDGSGSVRPGLHYPTHQDEAGANFMNIEEQTLYFLIKGSSPIDITTSDVLTIAFGLPPITVEDFFGERLAENLALFLDIPPGKIRRVDVMREDELLVRRRRAAAGVTVSLQIGDEPSATLNGTVPNRALSSILGVNVTSASINGPVPPVGSEEWSQLTVEPAVAVMYGTPASLRVALEPQPLHEGAGFSVQPKIQALDSEGNVISHLGYSNTPWEVEATLQLGSGSDARALLKGTTSVPYVDGWANFTDLQITHSGEDYTIHFTVSRSTQAPLLVFSQPLTVATKPVTVGMLSQPETATVDQPFSLQMELRDAVTGQALPDIAWKGMNWAVTVSLAKPFPDMYNGSLSGETSATFNPLTGYATFVNLQLSHASRYQLEFHVTNDQNMAEYDFTYSPEPVDVFPSGYQRPGGVEKAVQIKFDADFSTVQEHEAHFEIFVMNELNAKYSEVYISAVDASAGSIIVDFTLTGPEEAVDAALLSLWEAVNQPMTVTFNGNTMETIPIMFVNNERYYGTGVASGDDVVLIACIATVSAFAVIFITLIAIWRCKKSAAGSGKTAWSNFRPSSAIFRPSSATSIIKVKEAHLNQPPVVLQSFNPLKDAEENFGRKNSGFSLEEETRLDKDIESRPVSRATPSPTPRPTSPPGYVYEEEEDENIPMPRNMKVKLLDKTYRRIKLGRTWIDMKKTLDQARAELVTAFPAQLGGNDFRFMTANLTHVVQEVESEFHLKDIIARDCDVIALHMV